MANYAAVNGRCWKQAPSTGGTPTGGTPTGGTPRCPPTWSPWQNKCYNMHDADATWEEGRQICVELGGVMVVPQSTEELQQLNIMFSGQKFWIGCNDIQTEGTWVCLDEGTIDVQDKRWGLSDGQPDNYLGNEDCAEGRAAGWNDTPCGDTHNLLCQR
ncbi:C-type lectin domain family 4 member M-like [Asterias amurensis]|uniref:C-type lectin domain family 4 member M-like n=1 Tax=Asterias amurensis TaxID=7602 RepID=UPI003AB86427